MEEKKNLISKAYPKYKYKYKYNKKIPYFLSDTHNMDGMKYCTLYMILYLFLIFYEASTF